MNEYISIIVPVYNVEKYLQRCVDSLVNQTYDKLQIILIDDGSTDNSFQICQEYAKKDLRISAYHKENEGLGLTRNYGLTKATGKYITFVDSDDYIVPDAMKLMYQKAEETCADIVIGNMFYKDIPMEVSLPDGLYCHPEIMDTLIIRIMGNLPRKLDGLSYTATAKLYRRSLFIENALIFPSERRLIWEDLVFNMDAYVACDKIYIMHFPMYYYCFNEASLTHSYKPNKLNMIMHLYQYMTDKIKEFALPIEAQQRLDNNFIGHIRTCIKLEVYYAYANGYRMALENISKICRNKDVQTLIQNYPKKNFNNSQCIYNFFMKKQMVFFVYLLTWIQNKKKRIE